MRRFFPLAVSMALVAVVPLVTYAAFGMVQYEQFELREVGSSVVKQSSVTKVYDHAEGVVCYVFSSSNRGGISCIKD